MKDPQACSMRLAEKSTSRPFVQGNSEPSGSSDDALSNNGFCVLLSRNIGPAKARLKVFDSSLLRLHEPAETDQVLISKPSVSLADILQQHRLSTKMKIGLAYTLARSVWQYYDSEWMGSGWTCDTIHFMLEDSMGLMYSCVHSSKPCFTVQFQSSTQNLPVCYDLPLVIHKFPRVLALGILLVDIARASYEDDRSSTTSQTQQQKANTDYMRGRYFCEKDRSWPDLGTADAARLRVRTVYKAATQSCFDINTFKNISSSTGLIDNSAEAEEHRRILYEKVVFPLEDIIDEMGWTDSLGHVDTIKFDEAVLHKSTSIRKSRLSPSEQERARSPASQRASGPSLLSRRQDSPAYPNAALFDDEMPIEGYTPEQYVYAISIRTKCCIFMRLTLKI
jgi:hypothetical protein